MKVKVTQLCLTLCNPMDYTVHGVLQVRIPEWVAVPFSRGILPTQGSNPGLLHCSQIPYQLIHQGSSRVLEWVADLSLLQGIFPTQESNRGLLHCRQILYQLSYQGSPTSQNKRLLLNCIMIIITMAIFKPFVTLRQVFFILYSSLNALTINYR